MAKLSLLLAVSQLTFVHSLPARDIKRQPHVFGERAITISSNLAATTSYSTAIESLQTASLTTRPSLTGVHFLTPDIQESKYKADPRVEYPDCSPYRWRNHKRSGQTSWRHCNSRPSAPRRNTSRTRAHISSRTTFSEHFRAVSRRSTCAIYSVQKRSCCSKAEYR
jgi:hypothetical protein